MVEANVYAPNGTLRLRQNGQFTGAFLGKWVILGIGASAEHRSQWTEGTAALPSGGVKLAALVLQADTDTPTPTNTSVQSGTPTPSETPTPSNTPSVTNTPSPTYTTTPTATSTLFPTLTPTPPGTDTPTPSAAPQVYSVVIDYTYDSLQRLVAADYSTGEFFHYSYDPVGNRLTRDTLVGINSYTYDIANRLIDVDGVPYTWDAKGNLLDDGATTYTYDHANRLVAVAQGSDSYAYAYNGLGDRLRQSVNAVPTDYKLDLAGGLTQVLADGSSTYFYGLEREGRERGTEFGYYLGDVHSSVGQIVVDAGQVLMTQSFSPYGGLLTRTGTMESTYGFAGEWADANSLIHLRARYYGFDIGRFLSRDLWPGTSLRPHSLNRWTYALNNPIAWADPSGLSPVSPVGSPAEWENIRIDDISGEFLSPRLHIMRGLRFGPLGPLSMWIGPCGLEWLPFIPRTRIVSAHLSGLRSGSRQFSFAYSFRDATRVLPVSVGESLSDESASIRTLVGEMGDRLIRNSYRVLEGASILYTAINRLNTPLVPDPEFPGRWLKYTGCNEPNKPELTLATCLGGGGYYGLTSSTAGRDPLCTELCSFWINTDEALEAVDVAATIFELVDLASESPISSQRTSLLDPIFGAQEFAHVGTELRLKRRTDQWIEQQGGYGQIVVLTVALAPIDQ